MKVDVAVATRCALGEGPVWDPVRGTLLWLDIDAQVLHSLDADGVHTATPLDRRVSLALPTSGGGLVTAGGFAVHLADEQGGNPDLLTELPHAGESGTNDGAVDRHGSLWVGTVDRSGAAEGAIFRVTGDGSVSRIRSGVALSNGIDWSPDGRRVYHADSLTGRVDTAMVDDSGLPLGWSPFVELDTIPDGLTVDAEGGVWLALWNGGSVHRYTPDGRLDRVVAVPGGHITSCAFGGSDLSTLFITTARVGLDDEALARQPHAGALFALDAGVTGRAPTPFADADGP